MSSTNTSTTELTGRTYRNVAIAPFQVVEYQNSEWIVVDMGDEDITLSDDSFELRITLTADELTEIDPRTGRDGTPVFGY